MSNTQETDVFLEIEIELRSRLCPNCGSEDEWNGEDCSRCDYPYFLEV